MGELDPERPVVILRGRSDPAAQGFRRVFPMDGAFFFSEKNADSIHPFPDTHVDDGCEQARLIAPRSS